MKITDISIPTIDEMNGMRIDKLKEWHIKLALFYAKRFKISELYGSLRFL